MNIAVITGASSGIGREFAMQIDRSERLDEIWLIARRREPMEALASELTAKIRVICLDLLKQESFDEYKAILENETPNIRYMINASGFGEMGDWSEIPLDSQLRMIDLNIKALVAMTVISLPFMSKGGNLIEIGSASVFNPLPYFNVYASAKSFVRHYSRALHEELKPLGINVTVVCPGWVRTEFFDHTNDSKVRYSPKAYKPMLEKEDVVRKSLKAVRKNKPLCVVGKFTKLQHVLSKLVPHSILIAIWKRMLKDNHK